MNLKEKIKSLEKDVFDSSKYKRLKVTATLNKNISVNGYLYLDSILAYARLKKEIGDDIYNLPEFKKPLDIAIPVEKKESVFLCSHAQYGKKAEYINKWRKRFDDQKSEKYMIQKKVDIGRGVYKNYDMPLNIYTLKEINWVVIGDKELLLLLLQEVNQIGKKGSQGYGIVKVGH